MAHDIAAIGNALVDTQFMVELDFLHEIGMKPDEMVIQSREEQNAILDKLLLLNLESVVDCGGSATNSLVAASYFGSSCHHVCKLNDDEDGNKYLKSLSEAGIDHIGIARMIKILQQENVLFLLPLMQQELCAAPLELASI